MVDYMSYNWLTRVILTLNLTIRAVDTLNEHLRDAVRS